MLEVAASGEALGLLMDTFAPCGTGEEKAPLACAVGRVLRADVLAPEDVPGFLRSSVDGYAVRAGDTFGCSDSIPALLIKKGEVEMGQPAGFVLSPGECAYVPTGGQIPDGADAMVMIEYTESYGDDTVGILKAAAPGGHCVFRGDDVKAGQAVFAAGRRLRPHDIGTLAAMGITEVTVAKKPLVGILSTGNELVPPDQTPAMGQMRDVNGPLLAAAAEEAGADVKSYGICPDDPAVMTKTIERIATECDMVLLSGGTSVGMRDAAARAIEALGRILVHGVAIKPGKPTILGEIGGKPVFGMPGHPVAAYFIFRLFTRPLISALLGMEEAPEPSVSARLTEAIPSNHGREECVAVTLQTEGATLLARPIMGKSGLITLLSGADGYLRIPRDAEGLGKGQEVKVLLF